MKELITQKNNLHHAYLIEGGKKEDILDFLEKYLNFSTKNNPDLYQGDFDTFGIDDGRKINELQSKKSFSGGKQIFIIKTNFITREAQNSLLKMFEEPTPDTHFFLIMSSREILLPTLKSRLMMIKSGTSDAPQNDFTEDFLKMMVGDRIKFVQKFVGDSKKKIPADKSGAIEFLNQLETRIDRKNIFVLEEIFKCRSYLNDRSPSVKMLLEHLCVIL